MQLVTIVEEVLAKGELSMTLERRIHSLLTVSDLNEMDIAAIKQLIDAMHKGKIRSVPDGERLPRGNQRLPNTSGAGC